MEYNKIIIVLFYNLKNIVVASTVMVIKSISLSTYFLIKNTVKQK